MIKKILCPVDFSEISRESFGYARELGQGIGAEVVVAHAFDRPAHLDMASQHTPADPTVRAQLDGYRSAHSDAHLTHVLHAGEAGQVICWLAQEHGCELIVMGTHGRSGLAHLLMGSTTEYVLRHARVPVLIVRQKRGHEKPLEEPLVLPRPAPRFM